MHTELYTSLVWLKKIFFLQNFLFVILNRAIWLHVLRLTADTMLYVKLVNSSDLPNTRRHYLYKLRYRRQFWNPKMATFQNDLSLITYTFSLNVVWSIKWLLVLFWSPKFWVSKWKMMEPQNALHKLLLFVISDWNIPPFR